MDQPRKHKSKGHTEKKRLKVHKDASPIPSSSYCRSVVHQAHHNDVTNHKRNLGDEWNKASGDASSVSKRHMTSDQQHNISKQEKRRDHRNSPVELVFQGCRITDSSSSSSNNNESDSENRHQRRHQHQRQEKRRHHEESFEELSRRKRRIESELHALDEEEAALRSRRENRSHRDHYNNQYDAIPARIKTEPMRDGEVKVDRTSRSSENRKRRRNGALDRSDDDEHREWGKSENAKSVKQEREKPNFETSGKLAEDTNTYNGVVIKYNEPGEARKPKRKWRLYPFKGDEALPFIPIHRQSAYLLGRSRLIADIPIDHPSCSKQHAVLQFRLLPYERPDGTKGKCVRPYIIDLDSSNGTYVNNIRVESRHYVELLEKDVLKFGFSSRVYVILHEESKNEDDNDSEES